MADALRKVRELIEQDSNESSLSADEFRSFTDNSPINIMYCDRDLTIRYMNQKSRETLESLEQHLPISVSDMVGAKIDVFHKVPTHQRRILSNPKNLPHRAIINVGPEKLDLLVSAVYSSTGTYTGAMVTWDVVTQKLATEEAMTRISNMMENAPVNVIYADASFKITYVNPKSLETLKSIEEHLPIAVDEIIGSSIDVFHKNPAHQRKLLANDRNLPHRAIIAVGPEKLDLLVTAIFDTSNKRIGTMVTWDLVTEKFKLDAEMAKIRSMVENAPINIMLADTDFKLVYLNPASINTLRGLQRYLPRPVEQLKGESIDIFHKNPEHQRRILSNDKNLPHRAKIRLGDQTLDLLVSAIYDSNKVFLGPMVTWDVITDRVKLVQNITEAATQLASAASELNATATQMSSNSEQTTNQAGTVSAASEEVAKGVETVATNTEEMLASIKEIARNANEASSRSNDTRVQAQKTNVTIGKLGDSSQEIGNVIKVISSIAQQTNLLALNATIEAARAGDAGRGFAVVANEVKELAKQTATATEEITKKIGAIQTDTGGAVKAISEIGVSIEQLNAIASAIAASVEEQLATTNEVARVVQQSNQGVQSIADNIKGVSAAAVQTSGGATQVLEAARGLQDLATRMQELVRLIST
jgi:methyl-accepting chemotaxis protein